jgi:hypothetical protein
MRVLVSLLLTVTGQRSSSDDLLQFRTAFEQFDRNLDGHITLIELAGGILSSAESFNPYLAITRHYFGERLCLDPFLDALSFSECAVARARIGLISQISFADKKGLPGIKGFDSTTVTFEQSLKLFLSGCKGATADWLSGCCMASCNDCIKQERETRTMSKSMKITAAKPGTLVNATKILISSDWHVEPWYLSTSKT